VIVWGRLAEFVAEYGSAALVSIHDVKGSAPRERGARMVVRPDGAFHGTIGGGQLEWKMLSLARDALRAGRGPARLVNQSLGPDLGQCCGGRVIVLIETFDARDAAELRVLADAERRGVFELDALVEADGRVRRALSALPEAGAQGSERWREVHGDAFTPLYLFGAGHVGRALTLALAPLPFAVRWIDSRDDAFPSHLPSNVTAVAAREPAGEIARAPADAFVAVMTHDHPLDLAITAAALTREFPYVGLIGSDTKRARFERRLRDMGVPEQRVRSLVCPIGLPDIRGKEPAVIAASVVAQLLQVREKSGRPAVHDQPLELGFTA
jgi:xanthine dehydrogenase accessory factor